MESTVREMSRRVGLSSSVPEGLEEAAVALQGEPKFDPLVDVLQEAAEEIRRGEKLAEEQSDQHDKVEAVLGKLADLLDPVLPLLRGDGEEIRAVWKELLNGSEFSANLDSPAAPVRGKKKRRASILEPMERLYPLVDPESLAGLVKEALADSKYHEALWQVLKDAFDPPREEEEEL